MSSKYEADRIQPWSKNPSYWQHKGRPILLIGGSREDNLFQIPELEDHLEEMVDCGANYIRNTISSRDPGNVQPFKKLESGLYDLEQWEPDYWERFEKALILTNSRDIIMQIELWDRFDYLNDNWDVSPWNPKNNVNYTSEESGLAEKTASKTNLESASRFFYTVPGLDDNKAVLQYQNAFVEKILSHSLDYDNVLYCISNEAREPETEWNHYWARFIKDGAARRDRGIELTDMYWEPDLLGEKHTRVYRHPQLFSFSEVSQNSACNRDVNWQNLKGFREHLTNYTKWPMNSVKIYGSVAKRGSNMMASEQDAIEKFFRNLLGGCASSRFHRPASGLGLGDLAKQCIMSARLIEAEVKFWDLTPRNDLLIDRAENSAFLAAYPGQAYLLFMPYGGRAAKIDLTTVGSKLGVKWLDIGRRSWQAESVADGGGIAEIIKPGTGNWIALMTTALGEGDRNE